jgi:hypothetical protein
VLQAKVLKSRGAPLHVRATNKQCNMLFCVGRLTFLLRQIEFFFCLAAQATRQQQCSASFFLDAGVTASRLVSAVLMGHPASG